MARLIVISWRDIPAQVVVKRARETAKVRLSPRFQEAVDRAAMRAGRGSSDAYLADWKRNDPRECGDDLAAEAAAEAGRLEARYSNADLERLVLTPVELVEDHRALAVEVLVAHPRPAHPGPAAWTSRRAERSSGTPRPAAPRPRQTRRSGR
jgi:hypothetical protein